MKKKTGVVLAIILVLCTLSITLFACAPKDPEAYATSDKATALGNVWDSWMKANSTINGDTLGFDVDLKIKDVYTDLEIALEGGLTKDSDKDEVIHLNVLNNKATDKNVIDLFVTKDGITVDLLGLLEKPLNIPVTIGNIGGIVPGGFDEILELLKVALVQMLADSMGDLTIDPVKGEDKTYDVKYTFDLEVNKLLDGVITLISEVAVLPESVDQIIDAVQGVIGDLTLSIVTETTGNTREKVKGAADGEDKYVYAGGMATSVAISAKKNGIDTTVENSIKLTGEIPEIATPEDVIVLENVLFPSNINGSFVMKDAEGKEVSKYDYTVNFDFTVEMLMDSIIECVTEKSAMPLVEKMFASETGKIFIEISHDHENCKIEHMRAESRPILTVAYDPANFDNNRVYMALNLRGILPAGLASALGSVIPEDLIGTVNGVLELFPYEDLVFSINPSAYMAVDKAKNPVNSDVSAVADTEVSGGSIEDILGNILGLIKLENGVLNIQFDEVVEQLLNLEALAGAKDIVNDVLALMFPGVATIDINAVASNEHIADVNVKEAFMADREFIYTREYIKTEYNNTCTICKGSGIFFGQPCQNIATNVECPDGRLHNESTNKPNDTKIVPIGSDEITFAMNEAGLPDITTAIKLYNEDGSQQTISYEEMTTLVGSTVKGTYTDLMGSQVTEDMKITEIIGLDKNIIGKPQTIQLVIGGVTGNSWYNFSGEVGTLLMLVSGMIGLPDISPIVNFRAVEAVIPMEITLTEIESTRWYQGATDKQQIVDENNIVSGQKYQRKDKLNLGFNFEITYEGGDTKVIEDISSPDATGKFGSPDISKAQSLTWGRTFTMTYKAFGSDTFTHTVEIVMDTVVGTKTETVENGTLSYGATISGVTVGEKTETIFKWTAISSAEDAEAFVAKYNGKVDASIDGYNTTFTFKELGTYELEWFGRNGESIIITINVTGLGA